MCFLPPLSCFLSLLYLFPVTENWHTGQNTQFFNRYQLLLLLCTYLKIQSLRLLNSGTVTVVCMYTCWELGVKMCFRFKYMHLKWKYVYLGKLLHVQSITKPNEYEQVVNVNVCRSYKYVCFIFHWVEGQWEYAHCFACVWQVSRIYCVGNCSRQRRLALDPDGPVSREVNTH